MRANKCILAIISLLALILSFQNCSLSNQPVKFSEALETKIPTAQNGHGYDGKVYLVHGEICQDGSSIHSKIVLKTVSSAELVRHKCQNITPLTLTESDFQFDATAPDSLSYSGESFIAQVPAGGIVVESQKAYLDAGFGYSLVGTFGTPADNETAIAQSKLQLFEDGIAMGPAHSDHLDIANIGLGRFAHWFDGSFEYLRFSALDNSNPATNGRIYSYKISK